MAAHRTVRPSGCEPWLLKDLCHPELDCGGGERNQPLGGGKLEVPSQRPHSLLRDGLLLLLQSAEAAAVPVGECGRRSLPLFRSVAQLSAFLLAKSNCGKRSMGGGQLGWESRLGGPARSPEPTQVILLGKQQKQDRLRGPFRKHVLLAFLGSAAFCSFIFLSPKLDKSEAQTHSPTMYTRGKFPQNDLGAQLGCPPARALRSISKPCFD